MREKDNKEIPDKIISPDTQNFYDKYGKEIKKEMERCNEEYHYTIDNEPEIKEEEREEKEKIAKSKGKKRRRKKHFFLNFCVTIILVVGLVVFANSSFFAINKITVRGNNNYSADEIIKMSGIKKGDNLFRIREGKVRAGLTKDSYVEDVEINRKLPKQLIINITEREEAACVPYGNQYIIIDNQGYILKKTEKTPEVTILRGMTIKTMDEGNVIEVKETDTLNKALSLIKVMKKNDLFFMKIKMSKVTIRAYIYDNLVCKGTPENIKKSMNNGSLEKIIYDLYKKKVVKGTVNIGNGKYCSYTPKVE